MEEELIGADGAFLPKKTPPKDASCYDHHCQILLEGLFYISY